MKRHVVLPITAFIVAVMMSTDAPGQLTLVAQDRSIAAEAHATAMTLPPQPVDDVKSATASDFADFNPSLAAVATVKYAGTSGTASSASFQNSHLASMNITASGAVSAQGYRIFPNVGEGLSNSVFSSTFVINSPAEVQINVILAAHIGSFVPFFNTGVASFSLIGGTTNLTIMTAIPQGQMDDIAQLNQTLSLDAGTYTLAASARSDSGSPTLGALENSDLSARANFSISLNIVPEPSSIALCATCTIALLLASNGVIKRATARRMRNCA